MFIKVLVCLLPLLCSQVWSLPCDEFKKNGVFTCANEDKQIVTIFDQDFKCPEGSICNHNYEGVSAKCSPCISTELVCGTVFKCLTDTTFNIGLNDFSCAKEYKCNKDKKTSCKPCYQENCDTSKWKCLEDGNVEVGGIVGKCPPETECNKDYIHPCDPCIPSKPALRIPMLLLP